MRLAGALLAAAVAVAAFALTRYPGSASVFVFFNLGFLALAASVLPPPRPYVYTFLAAFLLLGFWLKVLFHAIFATGFVEPVGSFAGTPPEWDRALLAAGCGALGVVAARCLQLWHARARRRVGDEEGAPVPGWYVRWRKPVWVASVVAVAGVNAANLYFAFYQIGVKPKLLLPLHGHVLLAWLVNIGFALWGAALVWWEYRRSGRLRRNLLLPLGESMLSGTSAFSRMNFLLHSVPYALALFERRGEFSSVLPRRWRGVVALAVVLFAASVVSVFWLREMRYYKPEQRNFLHTMSTQVPLLIVHRWIGLEGVLAVGSANERGIPLLVTAVTEDPKLGDRSLFQRVAKANVRYATESDTLVFLSNAGPVAVLLFSGSLAVVFAGMALIALALLLTEEGARRLTGNPFLVAIAGAALANVVSQTTFFYLTLVFLGQLWVAFLFVAALQRLDLGNSRKGQ